MLSFGFFETIRLYGSFSTVLLRTVVHNQATGVPIACFHSNQLSASGKPNVTLPKISWRLDFKVKKTLVGYFFIKNIMLVAVLSSVSWRIKSFMGHNS